MTLVTVFPGGAPGAVINITDRTVQQNRVTPASATASWTLSTDGTVRAQGNIFLENWITPQTGMSGYQVFATHTGGTLPSGIFGTWTSLSVSQGWGLTQSTVGAKSGSIAVQIRYAATGVVKDTAAITISVSVDPG